MLKLKKINLINYDLTTLYYLFSITRNILLYLPVLVLFLEMTLENSSKVGIVLFSKSLTVSLLEIPLGYFSDKVSRKFSLKLSIILNILSLLCFIYHPTFLTLILAEILFGISETFSSGADIALIYDNYKYQNKIKEYDHYQRNEIFILSIVLACSFFLGSILYELHYSLVFIFSLFFLFFSFVLLLSIPEYPYKQKNLNKPTTFWKNIKLSLLLIIHSKKELKIHVFNGVLLNSAFMGAYMYMFPIILNNYTHSKIIYGFIYAIAVLLIGIGGKFQNKIPINCIFIFPLLMFLVFLLCTCLKTQVIVIIISFLFMRLIWGIYNSYFLITMNHLIKDSIIRATFFSFYNAAINLLSGSIIFILGFVSEHLKKNMSILFLSFLFLIVFLIQKRKNFS
ncbi:hypothetical protein CUN38_13695 [Enterococcus faecium]|uniref:MFS transporter n=1 Tax=Enterococcus faecium TaxID=1352 RepID=UPI000CF043C9|nr:MFS transporter [Enterococcus faecium]EGP5338616.1 MFS transporter [Enterococcus faecium]EME8215841.1 MFS transporter [Enterococcus faecium]EMF0403561.1 MFS transporter [Enterococcus faecium]EMF0418835.1 MFS transporter [Enterococcus faecium]PQC88850.1 hypothetical protein CUN38_13695 [Enterococcus faecium]